MCMSENAATRASIKRERKGFGFCFGDEIVNFGKIGRLTDIVCRDFAQRFPNFGFRHSKSDPCEPHLLRIKWLRQQGQAGG